jgi:hypothetical protein
MGDRGSPLRIADTCLKRRDRFTKYPFSSTLHIDNPLCDKWIPAFAGMTVFRLLRLSHSLFDNDMGKYWLFA